MKTLLIAKKIHFVGIKGSGMSALAQFFSERGVHVCGSDVSDEFPIDALLRDEHIFVEEFSTEHITLDFDVVIYSTAWQKQEEVSRAREFKIPTISYPEAIAGIFNPHKGIAICGSHGKSTTTAWLGYVLSELGKDPSVIVGSKVIQWNRNMRTGTSDLFVLEADEYQDKLSLYHPWSIILTNVDYDHPDFFKTKESYSETFSRFCKKVSKGFLVACWDGMGVRTALRDIPPEKIIRYGFDASYEYSIGKYIVSDGKASFTIAKHGQDVLSLVSPLPGKQNAVNALAVYAFCDIAGYGTPEQIGSALGSFQGIARRFEYKGMYKNISIIDDYAHHPTEISATLAAARDMYPGKKIWCVFSPHTFSRTETFKDAFARSFLLADMTLILDIFSSAREETGTFSSADLVALIEEQGGHARCTKDIDGVVSVVREHIRDIDILLTLGADEVWKVWKKLLGM